MSLEKAKKYLESVGFGERVLEFDASSATVDEAATAIGCQPAEIAKTMSLLLKDNNPILILTEGDAKIDNHKYKETFHTKAKLIPFSQVEEMIGHAPGGVCPFGIKDGIPIYLDVSLKKFDTVYPAAGNDHSAVKLSEDELEKISNAEGWVDVCKEPEEK